MVLKFNTKSKSHSLQRLLDFDAKYFDEETLVIGLDEVGRGCLAGPVVTAAFAYDISATSKLASTEALSKLNDSKKLNAKQRNEIVQALESLRSMSNLAATHKQNDWLCSDIAFRTAADVDSDGIVACIWSAMMTNLENILSRLGNADAKQRGKSVTKRYKKIIILVDGPRKIKGFERLAHLGVAEIIEQHPIIRGDSHSAAIAVASNIAKVARDSYMQELAESHPHYAWQTNVGYGTEAHRKAIQEHGLIEHHRRSFCGAFAQSH